MKRVLLALAAAAGVMVFSGDGKADWGSVPAAGMPGMMPGPQGMPGMMPGMPPPGYGPMSPYEAGPPGKSGCGPSSRYGILPCLKKLFRVGGKCSGCDDSPPPPGSGMPGSAGASMPGTLVFPQHPYVRSPRDYFMK